MTRWEFRIVPCLAEGNASAACQDAGHTFRRCAMNCTSEFASAFAAQFKFLVIIIIICSESVSVSTCWEVEAQD